MLSQVNGWQPNLDEILVAKAHIQKQGYRRSLLT